MFQLVGLEDFASMLNPMANGKCREVKRPIGNHLRYKMPNALQICATRSNSVSEVKIFIISLPEGDEALTMNKEFSNNILISFSSKNILSQTKILLTLRQKRIFHNPNL